MDGKETETETETIQPVESDETPVKETVSETQQVENEPITIELIDKRLQAMTQTIIDTIANLVGPIAKGVDEVVEKDDDDLETDEDVNNWNNLDL